MLTALFDRRVLRRWGRDAARAETVDAVTLKAMRTRARRLADRVERVLQVADARLALPLAGRAAVRRPMHADWAWRPDLWSLPQNPPGLAAVETKTAFGPEAKIFHDCARSELTLRQIRNSRAEDVAPYGVRLDVFRFDGSFLSLVVDLPEAATRDLSRSHIVRLDIRVETESPLELFGRLNIRHGPNVEQIVREFERSDGEQMVEFDIATSRLNEKRVERAWVDLIFEGPEMNQITLRDMTLTRRPRAEV
jgi:hypothetical protein